MIKFTSIDIDNQYKIAEQKYSSFFFVSFVLSFFLFFAAEISFFSPPWKQTR